VNSGAANDMDTFGKRISPQAIQEIQLSAYRGRKLRVNDAADATTLPPPQAPRGKDTTPSENDLQPDD
jgi:hypothetical protein